MIESNKFSGRLFESLLFLLLTGINSYSFLVAKTYAHIALYVLVIFSFLIISAWDGLCYFEVKKMVLLLLPALSYGYINAIFGKSYTATLTAVIIAILAILMGCKTEAYGHEHIIRLYRVYCIGMLFSAIYYLFVYSGLGTYGYALKNNYAPMVLFAVILLYIDRNVVPSTLIRWGLILFLTYIMIILRCRSVVLCFLILVGLRITHRMINATMVSRKIDVKILMMWILALILLLIFYSKIYDLIYYGLKLQQLDDTGLDGYAGRRFVWIQEGYEYWKHDLFSIFFGSAEVQRVECFYLATLFARGILGLLLFSLPLLYGFRKTILQNFTFLLNAENNPQKVLAALMFFSGLFIGIFESGAPFSQGTTFFVMWFTMGAYLYNTDTCGYGELQ